MRGGSEIREEYKMGRNIGNFFLGIGVIVILMRAILNDGEKFQPGSGLEVKHSS